MLLLYHPYGSAMTSSLSFVGFICACSLVCCSPVRGSLPVGPLHHFGVVYLIDLRVSDDPHFVYRPVMRLGKLVAGVCSLPGEVVARGPVG